MRRRARRPAPSSGTSVSRTQPSGWKAEQRFEPGAGEAHGELAAVVALRDAGLHLVARRVAVRAEDDPAARLDYANNLAHPTMLQRLRQCVKTE